MHDDESLERFLTENKLDIPAAPLGELQLLQARTSRRRAWMRPRHAGLAAVMLSMALVLLVVLTRQPHPERVSPQGADIEAVLSDSYGTLDDLGEDDGLGLTWMDATASVD